MVVGKLGSSSIARSSFESASSKRRLNNSAAPITLNTWPYRPCGLKRSEVSANSIARSNWPAKSLRMPPMYQPRAKLGLRLSARSTNVIMALMSSP
jgi:hypothetical protein